MNSKNDIILRYLDGTLEGEEKTLFEKELSNSPSLQEQLSNYKCVFDEFASYDVTSVDDDYFRNMVPKFRSKLPGKLKRFPLQKVSFASAASLIVIMFLFLLFNRTNHNLNIVDNLNEHELTELWDKFSSDVLPSEYPSEITADSTVNTLYLTELNLSPESVNYYFADRKTEVNTIIKDISEEEADNIYKEIINKKYF
jgi:hypothetical protein